MPDMPVKAIAVISATLQQNPTMEEDEAADLAIELASALDAVGLLTYPDAYEEDA